MILAPGAALEVDHVGTSHLAASLLPSYLGQGWGKAGRLSQGSSHAFLASALT